MSESIMLFYNYTTNTFSTTPKECYVEVFEPFVCKRHEKNTFEKTLGIFTIKIRRDNWSFSKEGDLHWLWIDIYVQETLLLPISKSCRKADSNYHFSEHEITYYQYGLGHNNGKSPHTYMQSRNRVDWEEALSNVVKICNNYQDWIVDEAERLISLLIAHNLTNSWDIATFINLARRYESIAPNIISVYQSFIDKHCFDAMKKIIEHIENRHMNNLNKETKAFHGDLIWNYIKDIYLSVTPE